jgi:hypothetical protein
MTPKLTAFAAPLILLFSFSSLANEHQGHTPESGFFLGLGGSYDTVYLNQNITGDANATFTQNGSYVGNSQSTLPLLQGASPVGTFASQGQAGYLKHFDNSHWYWGAKFLYQYLGFNASNSFFDSMFVGESSTPVTAVSDIAQATSISINHELALFPLIGFSFKNNQIYLGVGPSLFQAKSTFSQETIYSISGANSVNNTPILFNDADQSHWIWGGIGQVGLTHYFSAHWFVDINYSYAFTGKNEYNDSIDFTDSIHSALAGVNYSTQSSYDLHTSEYLVVQSLSLTVNALF